MKLRFGKLKLLLKRKEKSEEKRREKCGRKNFVSLIKSWAVKFT